MMEHNQLVREMFRRKALTRLVEDDTEADKNYGPGFDIFRAQLLASMVPTIYSDQLDLAIRSTFESQLYWVGRKLLWGVVAVNGDSTCLWLDTFDTTDMSTFLQLENGFERVFVRETIGRYDFLERMLLWRFGNPAILNRERGPSRVEDDASFQPWPEKFRDFPDPVVKRDLVSGLDTITLNFWCHARLGGALLEVICSCNERNQFTYNFKVLADGVGVFSTHF